MLEQAFFITVCGMGGVFLFLSILILCMNLLKYLIEKTNNSINEKLAIAIAAAKRQEN